MKTRIEWTQATWNPTTGCSKISPGCRNCYAERMAKRLQAMGQPRYRNGFAVVAHEEILERPLSWHKPHMIFVNSMSDLFHEDLPLEFIRRVFDVMVRAKHHVFQILTKRARRLAELADRLPWPENVWMGVTVENADYTWRIDCLRQVPAAVRFVSLEPLLGPIDELPLQGVHWVIVGGESGPGARHMDPHWVRRIRDQCVPANVAFFFKQWGGVNKKATGRALDGRTWDEFPQAGAPDSILLS
ncbi:MAG: phage Gp37/Gp68 family protein [Phycisphaerae bacterium]|nr:phage Gp37/Gp68 family protein [Phycisphaerae bacterium]